MRKLERIEVTVKGAYKNKGLLVCERQKERIIVKADFKQIYPEDRLLLSGYRKQHKYWGEYFETVYYREIIDELWLAKWLKMSKKYGNKTIERMVIDKKGIESVWGELQEIRKVQKIFQYMLKNKIPEEAVSKIERDYKWKWEALLADPYKLLTYAPVAYSLVQKIIKIYECKDPISSKRRYLVESALAKASQSGGHYYLKKTDIEAMLQKHGVPYSDREISKSFVVEDERIYLKSNHETEKTIAENIKSRLRRQSEEDFAELLGAWEEEWRFTLAANQKQAALMAMAEAFSVITGGPGVGKTTVCKCITDLLGKTFKILMVAPTGRAAKRAKESTGLNAVTIHSALEYNGVKFFRNRGNPIECDALVIDESSMIDAPLLLALLEAAPREAKIIFVGDADQLPSVGPGQILRDMIESGRVPVTRLTEIFRQAADSPIIACAYKVNAGEMPDFQRHEDLTFVEKQTEEDIFLETVAAAELLYREHDMFEAQVIAPMYKGTVGIHAINRELQRRLNPFGSAVSLGDYEIRENDKVIQTRNDYGKKIYNGDVGVVTYCSERKIKVKFQGNEEETEYLPGDFQDMQLSYAITVHRAQGSEYQFVVLPTALGYANMLQKNLLYTAITRAKKRLWMIYQTEALKKAVTLESVPKRNTTLGEYLKTAA